MTQTSDEAGGHDGRGDARAPAWDADDWSKYEPQVAPAAAGPSARSADPFGPAPELPAPAGGSSDPFDEVFNSGQWGPTPAPLPRQEAPPSPPRPVVPDFSATTFPSTQPDWIPPPFPGAPSPVGPVATTPPPAYSRHVGTGLGRTDASTFAEPGWTPPTAPPLPPGPGWPPLPGHPPAGVLAPSRRRPSSSQLFMVLAAVVAVALVATGVFSFDVKLGAEPGPEVPKEWDSRVADLVKFVEKTRRHEFEHPVAVDFLTDDEYSSAIRVDGGELSDDDRTAIDDQVSMMRAVGVVSGELDLFGSRNEILDNGTLAFYDPATQRVRVRGTEVDVELQVTLVHELTHVLQDQLFDLNRMNTMSNGEASAFHALVEGDAVRVERVFVEGLPVEEQTTYEDANGASVDEADTELSEVPQFLQATFALPYFVGPPMAELLADRGTDVLDDAFRKPPKAIESLFDYGAFLDSSAPDELAEPALPDGATKLDGGTFGADSWYLLLAQRTDAIAALDAVDGWTGDSYVQYRQDDTTCLKALYQGRNSTEGREMVSALQAWAGTMPPEAQVVVETPKTGQALVSTCDPGPEVDQQVADRALDVLALPAMRLYLALGAQQGGLSAEDASEFAACALDHLSEGTAIAFGKGEVAQEVLIGATSTCRETGR